MNNQEGVDTSRQFLKSNPSQRLNENGQFKELGDISQSLSDNFNSSNQDHNEIQGHIISVNSQTSSRIKEKRKQKMETSGSDISSQGKGKKTKEQIFYDEQSDIIRRKLIEYEFFSYYDYRLIYILFLMIFMSNILINVDHGTLPGCTKEMSNALDLDSGQFGTLGSIVYAGLTLGAAVATPIFEKNSLIKPALSLTLMLNAAAIYLFGLSNTFIVDAGLRFMIGFFQVFSVIYMPVWADSFANENQKSIWMTFLILASPLGVIFGYIQTSFYVDQYAKIYHIGSNNEIGTAHFIPNLGWKWSFYTQAGLLVPMALGFLFMPQKYLDIAAASVYRANCAKTVHQKLQKIVSIEKQERSTTTKSLTDNYRAFSNSKLPKNKSKGMIGAQTFGEKFNEYCDECFDNQLVVEKCEDSLQELKDRTLYKLEKDTRKLKQNESNPNTPKMSTFSGSNVNSDKTFFQKLKNVLSNKAFLSLMGCLCGLFYVVTGIQFWLPAYLQTVIGVSHQDTILYFSVTSLSAPIGGVIVGGIITTSFGGYNNPKAMKMQCLMGMGAVICALPIPFFNEFYYVGVLFWGVLFFGGFVLPPVTGIMISSVDSDQKANANSIANLCYNLFGYLPAPLVYGIVVTNTNNNGGNNHLPNTSKWGMIQLMYSTIFTVGLLLYGISQRLAIMEENDEKERRHSLERIQRENPDDDEQKQYQLYEGRGSGSDHEEDPLVNGIDNSGIIQNVNSINV